MKSQHFEGISAHVTDVSCHKSSARTVNNFFKSSKSKQHVTIFTLLFINIVKIKRALHPRDLQGNPSYSLLHGMKESLF